MSVVHFRYCSRNLKPGHVDDAFATEELTPVLQSTFAQKKGEMTNKKQKASLEQPEVADTTFGGHCFVVDPFGNSSGDNSMFIVTQLH